MSYPSTPWTLDSNFRNIGVGFTIKGADGKSIVACASSVNRPKEVKVAVAHLLVEAPALLAALESLLDGGIADPAEVAKAHAVVARVKKGGA